jgi:dephospho-CoA kinase
LIGLIGPIGCGKSTVAGWLAARGAVVVDADELTRTVMAPGTAVTATVVAEFGPGFGRSDGSLDRAALGRVVFSDSERLAKLEEIVHPAVERAAREAIRIADTTGPAAIVLEAIKLVEAGQATWCDELWLVDCGTAAQMERLLARGMSESDARQRVAAQASSLPLWRSAATRILGTDSTPAETEQAVHEALREALAALG